MIDVKAVQKNIFPGAHEAIWQVFPWHVGAESGHSSQALAVSVFGTLAVHPSRQALIDRMVEVMFGWERLEEDEWQVCLEMGVPCSLLGEPRPTQTDVVVQGKASVVFLECKFTESGGGPCSQIEPLSSGKHRGYIQCNGNHEMQTNPVNGKRARCALSAKGIRYWKHIPEYFDWADDKDHKPCPFAGPAYQYMRNAVAAAQWARKNRLTRAGFGLVYVAGEQFSVSCEVAEPDGEWNRFLRHVRPGARRTIQAISYQLVLEAWRERLCQDETLAELANWVEERVCAAQQC